MILKIESKGDLWNPQQFKQISSLMEDTSSVLKILSDKTIALVVDSKDQERLKTELEKFGFSVSYDEESVDSLLKGSSEVSVQTPSVEESTNESTEAELVSDQDKQPSTSEEKTMNQTNEQVPINDIGIKDSSEQVPNNEAMDEVVISEGKVDDVLNDNIVVDTGVSHDETKQDIAIASPKEEESQASDTSTSTTTEATDSSSELSSSTDTVGTVDTVESVDSTTTVTEETSSNAAEESSQAFWDEVVEEGIIDEVQNESDTSVTATGSTTSEESVSSEVSESSVVEESASVSEAEASSLESEQEDKSSTAESISENIVENPSVESVAVADESSELETPSLDTALDESSSIEETDSSSSVQAESAQPVEESSAISEENISLEDDTPIDVDQNQNQTSTLSDTNEVLDEDNHEDVYEEVPISSTLDEHLDLQDHINEESDSSNLICEDIQDDSSTMSTSFSGTSMNTQDENINSKIVSFDDSYKTSFESDSLVGSSYNSDSSSDIDIQTYAGNLSISIGSCVSITLDLNNQQEGMKNFSINGKDIYIEYTCDYCKVVCEGMQIKVPMGENSFSKAC